MKKIIHHKKIVLTFVTFLTLNLFAKEARNENISQLGCYISQQTNGEYVVLDPWNRELGRSLSLARATEIKANAENSGKCDSAQPPQQPHPPQFPPQPPISHPTPQPPIPPPLVNEKSPISVGQQVYNIQRNFVTVTVIAIEPDGDYVVRFEEGPFAGQIGGNWTRRDLAIKQGCNTVGYCVGEQVLNIDRNFVYAQIVGLEFDGQYVIRFLEGSFANLVGGHWSSFSLAKTRGCDGDVCIGDNMINIDRNYAYVRVVGIQSGGLFVLSFLSGPYTGARGGNWSRSSLIKY